MKVFFLQKFGSLLYAKQWLRAVVTGVFCLIGMSYGETAMADEFVSDQYQSEVIDHFLNSAFVKSDNGLYSLLVKWNNKARVGVVGDGNKRLLLESHAIKVVGKMSKNSNMDIEYITEGVSNLPILVLKDIINDPSGDLRRTVEAFSAINKSFSKSVYNFVNQGRHCFVNTLYHKNSIIGGIIVISDDLAPEDATRCLSASLLAVSGLVAGFGCGGYGKADAKKCDSVFKMGLGPKEPTALDLGALGLLYSKNVSCGMSGYEVYKLFNRIP